MSGEVEGGGRRRRRSRSGRHHHKRRREREVSCWCWGKWVIRSGHENDKMTSRQICDGSKSQRSGPEPKFRSAARPLRSTGLLLLKDGMEVPEVCFLQAIRLGQAWS
eukprot:s5_g37.t1